MLHPYHGTIRHIACLFAHTGHAEEEGNRIYEIAVKLIAPDGPPQEFTSLVRYGMTTARDHHASGITREALRKAPPLADVTAFLSPLLRRADVVATLTPRATIEALLAGCGSPRLIDLRFAAEFFLPQAESAALRPLWEHLHGRPREKFSLGAQEAVELSLELLRRICGHVLNPAETPHAAALRYHLQKSATLFGEFFCHLNRGFRNYFGGLFDPSTGEEAPEWKGRLEKRPPPAAPAAAASPPKRIATARLGDLYAALAAKHRGCTLRPSQVAYAGHVASALDDGAVLTIEAGTGTGKTQGYLIPVFEFLRRNPEARVAVSTYTKNLQEQIVRREIPLTLSLNRAYRKIPTALLMGKSNYLCAEKLDQLYDETLAGRELLAWLYFMNRIFHFREVEGDGAGERVRFHLGDVPFFRRLQQGSTARSGCSRLHGRCPAQVVSAEAQNARLVITNHHKLALLDHEEPLGELFRNFIIDEANHFEAAVRSAFAIEIASRPLADTAGYLESALSRCSAMPGEPRRIGEVTAALDAIAALRDESERFAGALAAIRGPATPGEALVLPAAHAAFHGGRLDAQLRLLRRRLSEIVDALRFLREPQACQRLGLRARSAERLGSARRDLRESAETLKSIAEAVNQPGYVTAATLYVRHWTVSVRAVEVAGILREHLYDRRDGVVFTSATLRDRESFDGFRRASGMALPAGGVNGAASMRPQPPPGDREPAAADPGPSTREFRFEAIPSPFDPAAVEIIVPGEALSGGYEQKEAWLDRVSALLPGLIRQNRGRTLVLFASYRDLEAVSARVADEIRTEGFPLLLQQNGGATAPLCDEFRAIRESVLFGVDSFWYGVDFPGETLTQVIITRLPYPHPQEPLQIARRSLLPKEEYWRRYRYEAAIKLRQGIGRLIRSESDRGRVVILDARYRGGRETGGR